MKPVLREPAIVAGILLNVVILVLSLLMLRASVDAFTRFTREDAFVEWMQFLIFAALGTLLAFVAWDKWDRPLRAPLPVLGLSAFSAVVLFAALEEVSYFQRVLGIASPDFFVRHNRQAETNLHNLAIGGVSIHKHLMVKAIFVAGITHNLILPALAIRRPAVRAWVERLGFYLPPLSVSLVTAVLITIAQLALKHPRSGEITELLGATHYFVTAAGAYLFGLYYADPVFKDPVARRRVAVLFVAFLGMLVLVAWLLGDAAAPAKS